MIKKLRCLRVSMQGNTAISAVIFDLDGTLVDSEPNYDRADERFLADYGIPPLTAAERSPYIGVGSRVMMEDVRKKYGLSADLEELLRIRNGYYLQFAQQNTPVFGEMLQFVKWLQQEQYPLAVASGSSPEIIAAVLDITGLRPYFQAVLSTEEVAQGKPAPDVFLAAAAQLGVAPTNCLVVEDAKYGVEAARRAGMSCLAIPSLLDETLPACFLAAERLVAGGMSQFAAAEAIAWLRQSNKEKSCP